MADDEMVWTRKKGKQITLGFARWLVRERPVTFVELCPIGTELEAGDSVGLAQFANGDEAEIESPVAGRITAVNPAVHVVDDAAIVNADPEGAGWFVVVQAG